MRVNLSLVLVAVILLMTYQNCGKQGENNFGIVENTSQSDCKPESRNINFLGLNGNVGTFQLAALDVVQSEWSVGGNRMGTVNGRTFTYTFPQSGTFIVSASGYNNTCFSAKYLGEKEVTVDVPGGPTCAAVLPQVTTNPSPAVVNLNERVTLTLANPTAFNTSTVNWYLGNSLVASGTNSTEITAAPVGNLNVTVTATQSACNRQESKTISIVANQNGAPALTDFNFEAAGIVRGTGLNKVYQPARNAVVKLNFSAANTTSATMANTVSCGSTACGANSFGLRSAEQSTATCAQLERELVLNGPNGTTRENFFVYCPEGQALCTAGRVANRAATEVCPGTPPTTTTTTTTTPSTTSTTSTTTTLPQTQVCRNWPTISATYPNGRIRVASSSFNFGSANVPLNSGERITAIQSFWYSNHFSGRVCIGNGYGFVGSTKTKNFGIQNKTLNNVNSGKIVVDGGCDTEFTVTICNNVPAAEVRNDVLCGADIGTNTTNGTTDHCP